MLETDAASSLRHLHGACRTQPVLLAFLQPHRMDAAVNREAHLLAEAVNLPGFWGLNLGGRQLDIHPDSFWAV